MEDPGAIKHLGGGLNTILNNDLLITDQYPAVFGHISVDAAIEIQFNRVLDYAQLDSFADTLMQVTLDGVPVEGFVSQQVNNDGSRLIFRPANYLEADKQYSVTVSANIEDLHGTALGEPYNFRFIAVDNVRPVLDTIEPQAASWRGGNVITLRGQGFTIDTLIEVGGQPIASNDVIAVHDDQLSFRVPGLSQSPSSNQVVGLSISNGDFEDFQPAAFTYIADPYIDAIGAYDRVKATFNPSQKHFLFNAGEVIGIQGRGLGEQTRIRINGREALQVRVENANLLSLVVPDNTLGKLYIEVSNGDYTDDTVFNENLEIEIANKSQLKNISLYERYSDLLATASANEVRLYSLRDSAQPQYLAKLQTAGEVNKLALSGSHIAVISGATKDLQIFDISNLYAPELVNTLSNRRQIPYQDIQLAADMLFVRAGDDLYYGNIASSDLAVIKLREDGEPAFVDVAISDAIYLLYADRVEVRDLHTPTVNLANYYHQLSAVNSIAQQHGRILLTAESSLQVLSDALLLTGQGDAVLAKMSLQQGTKAALNGELLAMFKSDSLTLYDMDLDVDHQISLSPLASVRGSWQNLGSAKEIVFQGGLLEWQNNTDYYNAVIPITNSWALQPARIAAADSDVSLQLAGNIEEWRNVDILPVAFSSNESVSGYSQLEGSGLRFVSQGAGYQLGETYSVSYSQQPASSIDGATVNVDWPWYITTDVLFGQTAIELYTISPRTVVGNQSHDFTVTGQQLQDIVELQLGNVALNQSQFSVSNNGLQLNFTATLTTTGLNSLVALKPNQRAVLPAAVSVVEPISITSVTTDHPGGTDRISDSGGNSVTVVASGLSSDISLHWYPANQGIQPGDNNQRSYILTNGQLQFVVPAASIGQSYQVTLIRQATGEQVDSTTVQLIQVVDDTAPVVNLVSALDYYKPLILEGSEPIQAVSTSSFTVTKTFKDYDQHSQATIDISDRFAQLQSSGNRLELRLLPGASLEHNAIYEITISGLQDVYGNQVLDVNNLIVNGQYSGKFIAEDLLPPDYDSITLKQVASGEPVTDITEFKRGSNYPLIVSAEDNYVAANKLAIDYRLSTDGGLSYRTNWIRVGSDGKFNLAVGTDYQHIQLLFRVSDGTTSVTRIFTALATDPNIALSTDVQRPAFYTDPESVEELTTVKLNFNLEGDLSLVTTAQIKTFDGLWRTAEFNLTSGQASINYENPRLRDILPEGNTATSTTVPVALRIGYGLQGQETYLRFDADYELLADNTSPELSIVSPNDGMYVPRGGTVDVILRSFDLYGIDYVEVCLNSVTSPDVFADSNACQRLTDPTSFSFVVDEAATEAQLVHARAVDLNGLQSTTATISLYPYDAHNKAPVLELLSPEDGSSFHAGEPLKLQLRMQNLTQAVLNFEIGADAQNPDNPAAINVTRTSNEPDVVDVDAIIPTVSNNTVLVVRAEATDNGATLSSRRYLNIIADDGIAEDIILHLQPATKVLSGTELWLKAPVPPGMDDFSNTSSIEVIDPATAATPVTLPMGDTRHSITVNEQGQALDVKVTLRDRSGHSKLYAQQLTKLSYLQPTITTDYQTSDAGSDLAYLTPVADVDQSLYWAENISNGGYRIRNISTVLADETTDSIQHLSYTGSGLLAQVRRSGENWLRFWPLANGVFTAPVELRILGELIGGNGNNLFVRYGNMINGYQYNAGSLLPLAGTSLSADIRNAQIDHQRIVALTAEGIHILEVTGTELPQLSQVQQIALPDRAGFSLNGDYLLIWQQSEVPELYRLQLVNEQLTHELLGTLPISGQITQAIWDGELVWLAVDDPLYSQSWQAWQGTEHLGSISGQIDDLAVVAGRQYRLSNGLYDSTIVSQAIAVTAVTSTPQLTVHALPFGVLVAGSTAADALGLQQIYFTNSSTQLLTAEPVWYEGELTQSYPNLQAAHGNAWFIPGAELDNGLIINGVDHAGTTYAITLDPQWQVNALAESIWPQDAANITAGSRIPVKLAFTEDDQLVGSNLTVEPQGSIPAVQTVTGQAYHWLGIAADTSTISYSLDYANLQQNVTLQTVANQSQASVLITGIQNNQLMVEGEEITLGYQVDIETGHTLKYVDVQLSDFNGNPVVNVIATNANGQMKLQVPAVSVQDNYVITVRAYLDDDYRYAESTVGFRVAPRYGLPVPQLEGLPSNIYSGSELELGLAGVDTSIYQTTIQVFDQNDNLLFSGTDYIQATLAASGIDSVKVLVTVDDGYGNVRTSSWSSRVINPLNVSLAAEVLSFDAFLPDVGDYWYSSGRSLYNSSGHIVDVDGTITALDYVGKYLLLAEKGFGLTLLDPQDGYTAVTRITQINPIQHVASTSSQVLAASADRLFLYKSQGTVLSAITDKVLDSPILDILPYGDHFLVLTANGVYILNASGSYTAQVNGNGLRAITVHGEDIYVTDNNGRLYKYNNALQGTGYDLAAPADRLIALNGKLIAIDGEAAKLRIIDIASNSSIQKVAQWAIELDTDVSQAMLAAGRIWTGDTSGHVLQINSGENNYLTLYDNIAAEDIIRGSISDVASLSGKVIVAASNYGAAIYSQNGLTGWTEQTYPSQPYTQAASGVAAGKGYFFVLQHEQQRVIALQQSNLQATTVFNQLNAVDVITTTDDVAVAVGGDIRLARIGNFAQQRTISVSGEAITNLTAHGQHIIAITDAGYVYAVDTRASTATDSQVEELTSYTGLGISQPAMTNDHLFYLNNGLLYRLDLNDYTVASVNLPDPVTLMAIGQGRLWIVAQTVNGYQLAAYDPYTLTAVANSALALSTQPTALAIEQDRIIVGSGSDRLQVMQIPYATQAASPVLASPLANTLYQATDSVSILLTDYGIASVAYYINDKRVAAAHQAPYAPRLALPAELPNGQTFTLQTRIESVSGQVYESSPRKLFLRSKNSVGNSFDVTLDVPQHSWLPAQFDASINVVGSSQPIALVELLLASDSNGPWQQVVYYYGPEYTTRLDFGAEYTGYYLKARAIDVFGNSGESAPVRFYRHQDNIAPSATMTLTGVAVFPSESKAIVGYPYTIQAELQDEGGGIEQALLLRNGVVVAAAFESGTLSYHDVDAAVGQYAYTLDMTDRAGNTATVGLPVNVAADQYPVISTVNAPQSIREQSNFNINLTATDDVGIKSVEIEWNGFTDTYNFSNTTLLNNRSFTVTDRRTERVTGSLLETLTLRVTDNRDQQTQRLLSIQVNEDTAPNINQLQVNVPQQAFYGGPVTISLSNVSQVDDAATGLKLQIFHLNADIVTEVATFTRNYSYQNSFSTSYSLPAAALPNDQYRLQIVATDALGQQSQSLEYVVGLTQPPNLVQFTTTTVDINPVQARVGQAPQYQVEVLDASSRPINNQRVDWNLRNATTGHTEYLGSSYTDSNGLATLGLDTSRRSASYQLRASLPDYPLVARAEMVVEVLAGDTAKLIVANLTPVTAAENFVVNIQANDSQFNTVTTDNSTEFDLILPPGFNFVAEDNLTITQIVIDGQTVERGKTILLNGQASFTITASTLAANYELSLALPAGVSGYYDTNGQGNLVATNKIPVSIIAAAPAVLRFLDENGEVQGDTPVNYGVKHSVPVQLVLFDAYGNQVQQVAGSDANYTVGLSVTGSGSINGQGNSSNIDLVNGKAQFNVTNTVFEEVVTSIVNLPETLTGVTTTDTFRILFTRQPPEIIESRIDAADGQLLRAYFTYDEPVYQSVIGAMITLTNQQGTIAGTTSLEGSTLTFTPVNPFTLNTCYDFSTTDSVLRGVELDDQVRDQQGTVCAPHVLINKNNPLQVLEGDSLRIPIIYGTGIDSGQISNGRAIIAGEEQIFDWRDYSWVSQRQQITVPVYSQRQDNSYNDGDLLEFALTGIYNQVPLNVGNTLQLQLFFSGLDYDGDGINNEIELANSGLNPSSIDSDGDGISDYLDDLDGDGLINRDELAAGTNLSKFDTDNDGLSDGLEVNTYNTEPLVQDTDGDGLSDGFEVSNIPSSSPTSTDTDNDGISDNLEIAYGLNPSNPADALADLDSDGLTNIEEIEAGTQINNSDSDGDGLTDAEEVNSTGTDPNNADTDADGLTDDEDAEPTVADIIAPTVSLASPQVGSNLLKGQTIAIEANATDNGRVASVDFFINGANIATDNSAPFVIDFTLPTLTDQLTISLLATDTNGNQASSDDIVFNLVDDPLTTVIGLVVDSQDQPLANVIVEAHGHSAVTQADGSFVITQVPVAPGNVAVAATGVLGQETVTVVSNEFAPEWGGTTDVGKIILFTKTVRVGYFHSHWNYGWDYQRLIIEKAGYEPVYLNGNLASMDLSNIDILLLDSYYAYSYYNSSYRQKVHDFVNAGGVVIHHIEYPQHSDTIRADLPGDVVGPITYDTNSTTSRIINVLDSRSEIGDGPHGSLPVGSLNESNASYGYTNQSGLADEVTPHLYRQERYLNRIAAISYPFGEGHIYFGMIRMRSLSTSGNYHKIYAPNVLTFMRDKLLEDSDGDGLKDIYEFNYGTSPFTADYDGDGLLDGFEVKYGFDPLNTNEGDADPDADGLSNLREQTLGTDPRVTDTDGDTLADGYEVDSYGSDPRLSDTDNDRLRDDIESSYNTDPYLADTDGDGLSDYDEIFVYQTLPDDADTDNDGLADNIELSLDILDPNNPNDATQDWDSDGLTNIQEIIDHQTDPKIADTDTDGVSDGDEVAQQLDPLDPDYDDDGLLDGEDQQPYASDFLAPTVSLVEPAAGSEFVNAQNLVLRAQASDDGRVTEVRFIANGETVAIDTESPYETAYTVPDTITELVIEIQAVDTNSNIGTTGGLQFTVINDPYTTVTGRIIDKLSNPVADVTVTVDGISVTTAADGTYTINNVPTTEPLIKVVAETLFGEQLMEVESAEFAPLRNQIITIGDMILDVQGVNAVDPINEDSLTYEGTISFNHTLYGGGYIWDFRDGGYISNGSSDAYDGGHYLYINGTRYTGTSPILTRLSGRELTLPVRTMGVFTVSRKIYSPDDYYVRYLDLIENTSGTEQTVTVRVSGNLGSDSSTRIIATSNGDNSFTTSDDYLLTDDSSVSSGDPAVGLLFAGTDSELRPSAVSLYSYDDYYVDYQLTIPAGERQILMSYAVQNYNRNSALAKLQELHSPDFPVVGLTTREVTEIVNFKGLKDTDADGIPDADEVPLGLDPFSNDTDGDQLLDGFERQYGFNPLSEAGLGETDDDPDNDGLTNLEEQTAGSDPNNADTDGDTLLDGIEVNTYNSDPTLVDTDGDNVNDDVEVGLGTRPDLADTDDDGLNDYAELYTYPTDPLVADTDGDGMNDGYEITHDLLNSTPDADLDSDGLTNLAEFIAQTNPRDNDTDNDLLWDGWEVNRYQTNPLLADSDSGGRWDIDELFVDGTDPLNVNDELALNTSSNHYMYDQNNRFWRLHHNTSNGGRVTYSTNYATTDAFRLNINGTDYNNVLRNSSYGGLSADSREFYYNIQAVGNLRVARRAFVPNSGGAFIRYMDIVANPTDQDQIVTFTSRSVYYASAANTSIWTSSNDSVFNTEDEYIQLWDTSSSTRPILSHLYAGPYRTVDVNNVNRTGDNWSTTYQVTIPAGERRIIMHFGTLDGALGTAQTNLGVIKQIEGTALTRLSANDQADIVNFFAYEDQDQDGLSNAEEAVLGTDPVNPDSDGDGVLDGLDSDPFTADTAAPIVNLLEPVAGTSYVVGDTVPVRVEVTDDEAVGSVTVLANNVPVTLGIVGNQYVADIVAPDAASLELIIRAIDPAGNQTEVIETYTVSPDPGTTVTGRILNSLGDGVADVSITVGGVTGVTASDGTFIIENIPTVESVIQMIGEINFGNQQMYVESTEFSPLRNQTIALGDMILEPQRINAIDPIDEASLSYDGTVTLGYVLTGSGYQWDIYNGGFINNGTNDAYDGGQYLYINNTRYSGSVPTYTRLGGRELTLPDQLIGNFNVSRKIYVPSNDIYARFLDIIENTSGSAQTVTVKVQGNLGSNNVTEIVATSNGDTTFTTADDYLLTDDNCVSSCDPAVGLLFANRNDVVRPVSVSLYSSDDYYVTHQLTIPAGERRILMSYAVQNYNRDTALTKLQELHSPDFPVVGLTTREVIEIVNFKGLKDSDADTIPDADEVPLGLDPFSNDTDGDQLRDAFEVKYGFNPLSDAGLGETDDDPDNDGLTNLEEQTAGSDPNNADTDGDTLLDGIEVNTYNSDPTLVDTDGDNVNDDVEVGQGTRPDLVDTDDDGLNDYDELYTHPTDPLVADTDGDGMNDGYEITYDLLNSTPDADLDSDGLTNLAEFIAQTNPRDSDTDNDLLWDGWEVNRYQTNPLLADSDSGGRWDIDELFVDGTDPLNVNDELALNTSSNHYMYDQYNRYWRIYHYTSYGGRVTRTTNAATTNAFNLNVNGTNYNNAWRNNSYGGLSADSREFYYNIQAVGNLRVARRVFVPNSGDLFIRYMDIVANPGDQDQTVTFKMNSYYAATSANTSIWTSSNDNVFTTEDEYIQLWDTSSTTRPILSHLYAGPYREVDPYSVYRSGNNWSTTYRVTIPAGERRIIMHLATMSDNQLAAQTEIESLRTIETTALIRLSASDQADTVNFYAYADLDQDGLSDAQEALLGTDPASADSDGDQLLDGEEVNRYGTDPLQIDTDGNGVNDYMQFVDNDNDGLTEHQESVFGTDPFNPDSDEDGLSDGDEVNIHSTDPLLADTNGDGMNDYDAVNDLDSDGLTGEEELGLGTDPDIWDTDGDGLSDGDEVNIHGTDPLLIDTDGDGINDYDEIYGEAV